MNKEIDLEMPQSPARLSLKGKYLSVSCYHITAYLHQRKADITAITVYHQLYHIASHTCSLCTNAFSD